MNNASTTNVWVARTVFACALTVCAVALLSSCAGYVPGAKAYWDAKVKEMCEKDGGVIIYEQIAISRADVNRGVLPVTFDGKLGIPVREFAHPDAPVYAERKTIQLNEWGPEVGRVETLVIRRSDQAVVARLIRYGRRGGDLPSLSHPSNFSCPDPVRMSSDLQPLFRIEESTR